MKNLYCIIFNRTFFVFFLLIIENIFGQYPANLFCNSEAGYTAPTDGNYFYNDWITNVSFAGINNNSIKDGWITRYNSTHGTVQQGQTYTLSVTVNTAGADFSFQYIGAYIDWNSDGDCGERSGSPVQDPGEGYILGQGSSHPATMTFDITVPNDAAVGTTWLRVMLDADTPGGSGDYQCYIGYGEVKDFPIDVSAPLPVELTTFNASTNADVVTLKWETATEVNNYGFEIERENENTSNSKPLWEKIGFVEGSGNSNSPKYYNFVDKSLTTSGNFLYRLKQIDIDGAYEYSDNTEVNLGIPKQYLLSQNFPNPFNPTTTINFSLPTDGYVTLNVYDVLGRLVAVLENDFKKAGFYKTNFDASQLSSGIYYYIVKTGNFTQVKKMLLMK